MANVINAPVFTGVPKVASATTAITARSGGGQASATALTTVLNNVATVAVIADSVKLPASAVGLIIYVKNSAANSMQVYGTGSDTIDGAAAATGVAQAAGKGAIYFCPAAGVWYQILGA